MNIVEQKHELIRRLDDDNISKEKQKNLKEKLNKINSIIEKNVREEISKVKTLITKTSHIEEKFNKAENMKSESIKKKSLKLIYQEAIIGYREAVECSERLSRLKKIIREMYKK